MDVGRPYWPTAPLLLTPLGEEERVFEAVDCLGVWAWPLLLLLLLRLLRLLRLLFRPRTPPRKANGGLGRLEELVPYLTLHPVESSPFSARVRTVARRAAAWIRTAARCIVEIGWRQGLRSKARCRAGCFRVWRDV